MSFSKSKSANDVTFAVDQINDRFVAEMKARVMARLSDLPTPALETIVGEHCRFSNKNPEYLAKAAEIMGPIDSEVQAELLENFNVEKTHGPLYKSNLLDLGIDLDRWTTLPETERFFDEMADPIRMDDPYLSLGAIYGSEGVSIFEHEIFKLICGTIAERKGIAFSGSAMEQFYDMHLEGLEQEHKEHLALRVDRLAISEKDRVRLLEGAALNLQAMTNWWDALLERLDPAAPAHRESLSAKVDDLNGRFIEATRARFLSLLDRMPERALEWLVLEHFQFSNINTKFLDVAAGTARQFSEPGIREELLRNLEEENGHAVMYKNGLAKIGTAVETRAAFSPTATFFEGIAELIDDCPSTMLGAVYATETAAIFEHEVFLLVCRDLTLKRGGVYEGSLIKHFHDMHLDGVEQSHKDGLGQFVDVMPDQAKILSGALAAIRRMEIWWEALLAQVELIVGDARAPRELVS
jgi:hypothetical protein